MLRILGGGGGGARGEANSQQAHDIVLTSMRRNDVASTSFRQHVPTRFFNKSLPNNYISNLKILYYRKFKNRIEKNSFASTFKSN